MRQIFLFVLLSWLGAIEVQAAALDFTGMWKENCRENFGLQIQPAAGGVYSISFCGPGGCFEPGTYRPNTKIVGDPLYEVVGNKLKIKRESGAAAVFEKCSADPKPGNSTLNPSAGVTANSSPISAEAERKLLAEFAVLAIEHYEIRGESAKELNLEMTSKNHGANGTTTGKVNYDFKCQGSGNAYAVRSISSTCIAKIRLPKWYGLERASPEMKAIWDTYYANLKSHEMGHVLICANAAKSVRETLESVTGSSDCSAIYSAARQKAEKVIAEMQKKQERYDAESLSGKR